MKNEIRTIDLIAYFEARIEAFSKIIAIEQEKWDAEKTKYEKTIWFRWFKQSFIESQKGALFMHPKWDDFFYSKKWKREAEEILQMLTYRKKCDMQLTAWDKDWYGWDAKHFYKWCEENNIPY